MNGLSVLGSGSNSLHTDPKVAIAQRCCLLLPINGLFIRSSGKEALLWVPLSLEPPDGSQTCYMMEFDAVYI